MDFIQRLVSQDQKNYRQKTKNLNKSINKTSTYRSHKDQITNHRATNLYTQIHKSLKLENTGGKKDTPTHKSQSQKDQNTNKEQQIWKNIGTHIHTHGPITFRRQ
jgi:hypothetical protein